jgi:hypothetical protein
MTTVQAEEERLRDVEAVRRSLVTVRHVCEALEARQNLTLGFASTIKPDDSTEGDAWIVTRLVRDPTQVATVAPESIPRVLGLLRAIEVTLLAKLTKDSLKIAPSQGPPQEDRRLTVEEASRLLGVTPRWLYRNAGRLPYARRLSRKALRFSELGLRRHLATKRG